MALSTVQTADTLRQVLQESADLSLNNISRTNMAAAITAVDAWATANAASYNTALPDPFKSTASAAEKAVLLAYVCLRRAGR